MKKMIIAGLLAIGLMTSNPQETNAQVQVNINIGQQPLWGPTGYDYVEYYYIPELNVYYDVVNAMYIYHQQRRWIHAAVLPPRFGHFDLFRMHKIVMNQMNPFRHNHDHMRRYHNYRGMQQQMAIRDARDYRYYANPRHPRHNEYRSNNRYSNNHRGPRYQDVRSQQRPNDRNYTTRGQRPNQRSNNNYESRRNVNYNRSEQRTRPQENRISQRSQQQNRNRQYVDRRSERNSQVQQGRENRSRNTSSSREYNRR